MAKRFRSSRPAYVSFEALGWRKRTNSQSPVAAITANSSASRCFSANAPAAAPALGYKEGKSESKFRQYDAEANPGVAEFYRTNHENQTVNCVLSKEKEYFGLTRGKKSVWEAAEYLNASGR